MKIVHIYKKHYDSGDGITNVASNLLHYQSKKSSKHQFIDMPFSFDNKKKAKNEYGYVGLVGLLTKLIKEKPDVIYLHGFFYIQFLILGIFCFFLKAKFIFVPHCSLIKRAMEYKAVRKKVYFNIFSFIYKHKIHFIQFLNEDEKNSSQIFKFTPEYFIVPNGVNVSDLSCLPFEQLSMFYLGRCDINHKGLDILLQYMRNESVNQSLDIFGASDNEAKKLKDLIIDNNINDKIKLFKPVFDMEKEKVFCSHNIFILLSRYEGLPISVLEALSYGCICLLSSGTNMSAEVVNNNCGFRVDTLNDFICALEYIQQMDVYEIERMSQNAKELVKNKYSWYSITDITISQLDELEYKNN
ncbi:TPA: glycosyltransferase family 4 protein [Citrobacter freundii]